MVKNPSTIGVQKREGADRRRRPTPAVHSNLFHGNRRIVRREAERRNGYYVDHPGSRSIAAILALLFLVVLDGVLTLCLIDAGADEANPLMAFFLSFGVPTFMLAKFTLTIPGLLILLLHKNFSIVHPRLRVKWAVVMCLSAYGIVVVYELSLFLLVVVW
jgi:hypothetical protein